MMSLGTTKATNIGNVFLLVFPISYDDGFDGHCGGFWVMTLGLRRFLFQFTWLGNCRNGQWFLIPSKNSTRWQQLELIVNKVGKILKYVKVELHEERRYVTYENTFHG